MQTHETEESLLLETNTLLLTDILMSASALDVKSQMPNVEILFLTTQNTK